MPFGLSAIPHLPSPHGVLMRPLGWNTSSLMPAQVQWVPVVYRGVRGWGRAVRVEMPACELHKKRPWASLFDPRPLETYGERLPTTLRASGEAEISASVAPSRLQPGVLGRRSWEVCRGSLEVSASKLARTIVQAVDGGLTLQPAWAPAPSPASKILSLDCCLYHVVVRVSVSSASLDWAVAAPSPASTIPVPPTAYQVE